MILLRISNKLYLAFNIPELLKLSKMIRCWVEYDYFWLVIVKYFFVFLGYTGWLLCYGHPMTSLSIKQLFLNFSAVLWEKIKQTIYGNLPTPHIQVTLYTHTYFCSKMAIKVTITKSISKPKNSAKMAVLHQISLQYKRILMEYTIWPLKGSKYEPRNWNWRVLEKIV